MELIKMRSPRSSST